MKNADTLYLFRIVEGNGDISPLVANYSYAQISAELSRLIHEAYLIEENGTIHITNKGASYTKELEKSLGGRLNRFIEPQIQYQTTPISTDTIYIPNAETIEDLMK